MTASAGLNAGYVLAERVGWGGLHFQCVPAPVEMPHVFFSVSIPVQSSDCRWPKYTDLPLLSACNYIQFRDTVSVSDCFKALHADYFIPVWFPYSL